LTQDEQETEGAAPPAAQGVSAAAAGPEAGVSEGDQPEASPEGVELAQDQPGAEPVAAETEPDKPGAEPPEARQEEAQPTARAERPERPRPAPGERRRRHFGRRKVCSFCVEKVQSIDYKDPAKLRRYLSDRGRIEARRKTGTCAKHQRWLATALKRARHLALLPYTPEHIRISGMFAARR
jgi:small subunit ribosomal protein S18